MRPLGNSSDDALPTERGDGWATIRSLLPYLWPAGEAGLRARVAIAVLAMLAAKGILFTVPYFMGRAVDSLNEQGPGAGAAAAVVAVPIAFVLAYAFARLLNAGFQQIRDALFARVSERAQRHVAVETFDHLHRLSLRFHLTRRTGALSRIIERGTRAIDFLLRFFLFSIVPTLIELIGVAAILAIAFGWGYAAVVLVTVIGYIWFTFALTAWRVKIRRRMNERDQEANARAIDSLLNFETVKYFGNEHHEVRRFDKSQADYEDAAVQTSVSLSLLNSGQSLIFTVGLLALMVMSGLAVMQGTQTVGQFTMINQYLIQLAVPLNMLGFVYREIRQALVDMERMFAVRRLEPEVQDREGAPDLAINGGAIHFEAVRFAYDPERPILHGIDFDVPAGRTVAIVGPSGAGKSTLSRILYRFYDVAEGRVLIDGQDIAGVSQRSLRAAIGMVPQDTVLFNETIQYNIAYGRPGASDAEVEEAARFAQIHEFINGLPDGYETVVGERGLKLSGGEKQRVAIARTILKNPPILILDEATSALDSHTEREIQSALQRIAENRTTLIIAHRLSTIVHADEILVMEAGRIVERGRHDDLLAAEGAYAALWQRQQEGLASPASADTPSDRLRETAWPAA